MSATRHDREIKIELEDIASTLQAGERTGHFICPWCQGGTKTERSFVVWAVPLGYGWKCWRSSCDKGGFMGEVMPHRNTSDKPKGRVLNPYNGDTIQLTRKQELFLKKRVGFLRIHQNISGVLYSPKATRFVFPIYDPNSNRRGVVLRSWLQEPKAVNRMEREEPSISWYLRHDDAPLIIVEDIPSAVRASMYMNAVALLGTHTTSTYMYEIIQNSGGGHVVWAFDADATSKAIKYARENRMLFKSCSTYVLDKDLKNMRETELEERMVRILHDYNNNTLGMGHNDAGKHNKGRSK